MKTKITILSRRLARYGIILALASFIPLAMPAQPRSAGRSFAQPRIGVVVQSPPRGFVTLNYGNSPFYSYGGSFYQRGRGGYVVVAPPVGLRVAALPFGFASVMFNGATFYSYNNVYYQPMGGGFVVVNPPVMVAPRPVIIQPAPVIVRPAQPVIIQPAPMPMVPLRR